MNHNKSWNTQSLKHVELVWKAEKRHVEEEKKIQSLRSEKKKQDQMAELRHLKDESFHPSAAERIDWMYRPMIGGGESNASTEAYLLGKKVADDYGANEIKQLATNPGSLFLAGEKSAAVDPRDTANKLRDDPLLTMRRLEKETKENIEKNPVQMQIILEKLHKEEKFRKKFKKELKKLKKISEQDVWVEKDDQSLNSERGALHRYKVKEQNKSSTSNGPYHTNHTRENIKSMSNEERKRKLDEMMHDAEENEEQRFKRLKLKKEQEEKEEKEEAEHKKGRRNISLVLSMPLINKPMVLMYQ